MKFIACVLLCVGCGSVSERSSLLPGDGPVAEAVDPSEGGGGPGVDDGGLADAPGELASPADALHEVDAVDAHADGNDGLEVSAQLPIHAATGPWNMVWEGGGCVGMMTLKADGGGGDWSLYGPFMCVSEFEGNYNGTVGGTQHGDAITLNIHGTVITAVFNESIDALEGTAKGDGGVFPFRAHR